MAKQPKLGTGARFKALESKLAARPGVTNPGALAAYIGRKRYGAKRFSQLSHHSSGASHPSTAHVAAIHAENNRGA